ncbi:MAG: D-ribose pyranase [Gaiellaceae bacterium]
MLRQRIINSQLLSALARLRHTDLFVISDSGFPTPQGIEVIDLGVVYGLPSFDSVLGAVLAEVVVEKVTVAKETGQYNPEQAKRIRSHLADVDAVEVSHEHLKLMAASAQFVVRTGEATPYSNVVLQAGVAFA